MTDTLNKQQILEQRYLLDDEQEQFMNAAERSAEREIERKQRDARAALQTACGATGHVIGRNSFDGHCGVCGCEPKSDKQIADSNLVRG